MSPLAQGIAAACLKYAKMVGAEVEGVSDERRDEIERIAACAYLSGASQLASYQARKDGLDSVTPSRCLEAIEEVGKALTGSGSEPPPYAKGAL